jgi:hypothetical protein
LSGMGRRMGGLLDGVLTVALALCLALVAALGWGYLRARAALAWRAGEPPETAPLPDRLLFRLGHEEHAEAPTLTIPRITD